MQETNADTTIQHQPVKGPRINKGLVIVNTGDGKGKTTAAMGVMLRAWGRNVPVRVFQFIKSGDFLYGEQATAARIGIPIHTLGGGCIRGRTDLEDDKAMAREQWRNARQAVITGDDDIVILDELTLPLHFGWLTVEEVIESLSARPPMRHVIITGRYAPDELIAYADLVTEMRVVKHPYQDQGITAQPGIEH